jgi:hypothetical protein
LAPPPPPPAHISIGLTQALLVMCHISTV